MATYDLKYPGAAIDAILDTAYDLQNAGYIFRGLASEYSNTPTERSWVLAGEGETGHGFTSPVPKGYIGVCVFNGTSWTGKLLKCVSIDSTPTNGSTNAVSSGGAYASISQLAATVNEALDNLTFTDSTPSAFLGEYIKEKVSTTAGGIERILTYFTILSATASKAGLLSAADKAKLDALWSSGYQFAGIATPSTTPISTTSKIFYIATEAGTYFNTVTVTQGINIIYKSGDTWSVAQVVGIDNEPTAGSDRLVKSGGVFGELALGAVYDVSAKNPTAGPNSNGKWESLSALLSDANLNTLIPTSVRKGGMSIKYVQSSDNKYVQYRLMRTSFSTTESDWQGVDDVPTAGSDNLVKSQGILSSLTNLSFCGRDTTFVSQEVKGLLKGHLYTLSFKNTNWDKHQDTKWSIFELWYKDSNDVTHDLINIFTGGTVYECYKFIIPDEAERIYYGGRAKDGVVVRFSIVDSVNTKIIPISNNTPISNNVKIEQNTITIKDNGFGLVNVVAGNTIGWIGYVSGEDESTSITIEPDPNNADCVYYIDLKTLNDSTRTSFSKAIKKASLTDGKYKGYVIAAYRKSQLLYTPLKDTVKESESRDEIFIRGNEGDLDTNVTLSEDGNSITLSRNGFTVCRTTSSNYGNVLGYVGYVEGVDEDFTFTFRGSSSYYNTFYYLDLSTLNNETRTAFKNAIKITNTRIKSSPNYVLLLFFYYDKINYYGLFGSIVARKAYYKSTQRFAQANLINFEPEFYAYSKGRFNNTQGEGYGWYDRFKIGHISDTHQYQALMKEAIEVSKSKVEVLINTGDDGNGMPSWTSDGVIANLVDTASVVNSNIDSLKYFVTPGNHDVPNITKKQYYDVMSPYFSDSYIWGDNEHYRMYGYEDITTNDMGTFRILVLDPFDYDDGSFPETRGFQTATFSQKQINWLIEALVYAANNSYHVITMMHYSFGDNSLHFNEEKAKPDATFYQDPFMIPDIIDAIQNKTILNKVYSDSQNINNITVNRDFSSVGNLDYVCHLFGHIHSKNEYWCQKTDGSKVYDILMLGESALGAYGNALNKVSRIAGTTNEIEFSTLEIDTIEKAIYRVNYGAYLKYDGSNNVINRTTKLNYRKDM